jgi:hypothetical protein
MFRRSHRRKKDGKEHRYFSIEESRRLQSGRVVQRRALYLGEIKESQQAAWRKSLEAFDEQRQDYTTLSLFPESRPVPAKAGDSVQVKLSEMKLRRARRVLRSAIHARRSAGCSGICEARVRGRDSGASSAILSSGIARPLISLDYARRLALLKGRELEGSRSLTAER